jgi:hypothetical protein
MKVPALAAILVCMACSKATDDGRPKAEASAHPATSPPTAMPAPQEALDKLDQRRPLPLLPMMAAHQKENMREHLEAVQEVVAAAAVNDFDKVAVAARRMGFSESMGRMCEHMGAGASGFTEQALAFHHTADEIVSAATRQDGPGVLAALSKTLRTCTSCHAAFKQQPVATLPE